MINSVTQINDAVKNPKELIDYSEKNYIDEIKRTAQIIADDDDIKIVALAGPSASGKTTTAHILCENLERLGEKIEIVSLDDFYLEHDKLPLLEDGSKDYESVKTLNIPLLNKCFEDIITKGKASVPRFDFKLKKSILNYRKIDISGKGIVIVEGLHALNPLITDLVPKNNIYKIYISVNCSIEDAFGEQLLSSRQIRLVRRSLRDSVFRNTSIENTLSLWNNVIEGDRKYLYPYKKTADTHLKTLHLYEPCVYRDAFLKLKEQVNENMPCYEYFMRTASAMEKFSSITDEFIPDDSLIREFIVNGKFKY